MTDTDQEDRHPTPPLPHRDFVTGSQVGTVLSVIATLNPFLLLPHREFDASRPDLDGECHSSAQTTFIKACGRLDAILEDDTRWTTDTHDKLYDSILKTQEMMQKNHSAHAVLMAEKMRPCNNLPVQLTTSNGVYVVFHVSGRYPGSVLVGTGNTPDEARADFDLSFKRSLEEQKKFEAAVDERLRGGGSLDEPVAKKKPVRKKK